MSEITKELIPAGYWYDVNDPDWFYHINETGSRIRTLASGFPDWWWKRRFEFPQTEKATGVR